MGFYWHRRHGFSWPAYLQFPRLLLLLLLLHSVSASMTPPSRTPRRVRRAGPAFCLRRPRHV
eukprot:8395181-Pyramimonas_sp.AAC.1